MPLPGAAGPAAAIPLPSLPEEDTQPPAIGHDPVRKAARGAPLRVVARIVDERSAVGDAQACWRNLFHIDFQCEPLRAAGEDEYAALIPAYLKPDDIANLALFLASDESCHINGAIIPADAGWTAA